MNIKDAYRYQKVLAEHINTLNEWLWNNDYICETEETHLKSKSNSEANDEVIIKEIDKPFSCTVENIMFLINDIINEKLKLTIAVESIKRHFILDWKENNEFITLDSAIEFNKNTRDFISGLKYILDIKSHESKKIGIDYTFNINKEQVEYKYPIEIITKINYNRNIINNLYKSQLNKADQISVLIESAMLKDVLDFTPKYSIYDSLNDIIDYNIKD
jgi:hypothetical protein